MALKTNRYYINYQNNSGLPIADANLAVIFGTDQQKKEAQQFLDWIDKQTKTTNKGGNRK